MSAKYNEGDYINFKTINDISSGTVKQIKQFDGKIIYVVAEKKSASSIVEVNQDSVIELLNG